MFDLKTALKANIRFVGVTTDDPINLQRVLGHYATSVLGLQLRKFTSTQKALTTSALYWTDEELASVALYERFDEGDHQMVFVNTEPSPLVVNCGPLQVPQEILQSMLMEKVGPGSHVLVPTLRGLSLKASEDILRMTQARAGNTSPSEVRTTRLQSAASTPGLVQSDTKYDFYAPPASLSDWTKTNKPFITTMGVSSKLVPRGLLLNGPPGVGKTMAAKFLSRELGLPLYRADITATLDKYIGVSEQRVARLLQQVDAEEPCIVLFDEVEKIFAGKDETGVTARIMSQLLWWLAEHKTRVLTIMTTNDVHSLPPELYRPGRIDAVFNFMPLLLSEAIEFSHRVLLSFFKSLPSGAAGTLPPGAQLVKTSVEERLSVTATMPGAKGTFSHSEVTELVYSEIKRLVPIAQLTS